MLCRCRAHIFHLFIILICGCILFYYVYSLRFNKEQLKVKLGTLSRPLEKQLTNTSLEKLNELTLNIFNINSEEDVLNLMN